MNLILSAWIPAIRCSGKFEWVAPWELLESTDPPVRLAWPRADFDVACLEFLIGLFAIALPPISNSDWSKKARKPDAAAFRSALERLSPWLSLEGPPGQRFLQDFDELKGDAVPLARMLIDAPGENTVKKNTDLFVKRSEPLLYSSEIAAMMLITFQSWAPAGGAGNRTSLRGGGPMTTIVEPAGPDITLFDVVWANVPIGPALDVDDRTDLAAVFPWAAPTPTSEKANSVVHMPSSTVNHYHAGAFFGMPRRVRLVFVEQPGMCAMTGRPLTRGVIGFIQRPYGINYGLWRHPCTPYYRVKAGTDPLPIHPKAGRFGYHQYLGVLLRQQDRSLRMRALSVDTYVESRHDSETPARLLVAGWAMSNMSALDFVESRAPLPTFSDETAERLAEGGVRAADLIAWNLASATAQAHSIEATDAGLPATMRQAFYGATEGAFHRFLQQISSNRDTAAKSFLSAMRDCAMRLFDEITLPRIAQAEPEHAARITAARHQLLASLRGSSKAGTQVFAYLELPAPPKKTTGKSSKHSASPAKTV